MVLLLFVVTLLSACSSEEVTISKEEFPKLKEGMSISELEKIVGGKGKEEINSVDSSLVEYTYPALDGVEKDGYVYILFNSGKVSTILDYGLLKKKVQHKKEDAATKDTAEPVPKNTPAPTQAIGWEEKVKEVSSGSGTTTEKFDEISKYAHDYKPSQDEIKQFGDDIIKEYKNKNYIKNIANHEYMLTNIFKSQIVDKNAPEKPIKDFAFDFWQNTKYNYRGVENTTSSATQANERQMDKALSKMNK
ncbi:hypothetical protein [Bacillus wiedmannii]|uniref:hypothetical protein n=1 Tax=Bacillus wiedmannii TaxID=1890302 RepID=UPI000D0884FF|nr:hypothetical protein [Bacillus wiedmannii]PRT25100.1 hypothetical protein C6360_04905 [Bacillus wiedmannii]